MIAAIQMVIPHAVLRRAVPSTRATPEECRELGAVIARKLNVANGPTELFVPLRGLSLLSTVGRVFHDPTADEALFSTLRELVDRSKVHLHEVDADLNDPVFALEMADRLAELVGGTTR